MNHKSDAKPERFVQLLGKIQQDPVSWLITGVAGFIGSNLLEFLLQNGQKVVGVDNFSNGNKGNLVSVRVSVGQENWKRFQFIEGTICDYELCRKTLQSVDHVIHLAALGSVPRSVENPLASNEANITGFLTLLTAAKDSDIQSFTYAASSSTYGDHEALPKVEERIGKPLSPYAVTKLVNEIYADVFYQTYGFETVGLRYFNVFGRRQRPDGAYAAVIPRWTLQLIKNEPICIFGDGKTSRDFCYIDNVLQMNLLAAFAPQKAKNQVYNVALGDRTSLLEVFTIISEQLQLNGIEHPTQPKFASFRPGDIAHSQADISKVKMLLGYVPKFRVQFGLEQTVKWFVQQETT